MSVIDSSQLLATGDDGYQISRSVRLRSSASAYFSRTPSSTTNRRTFTWSGWVKLGALDTGERTLFASKDDNTAAGNFFIIAVWQNQLRIVDYASAYRLNLIPTQVMRDPSAWYHVVVAIDTTQATSSDRAKVYVNGVQVTAFGTATYPSQNTDLYMNVASQPLSIGARPQGASQVLYFDGYLTEVNFIDGQALTPSSFGETDAVTGVWKPKKYGGTYGTNGFYLNFSDNSNNTAATIGKDYSGNGNNWTPNNISVTAGTTYDSMTDVPTLTSATTANYSTWNPLLFYSTTAPTITNGNLTAGWNNTSMFCGSTMACPNSGKTYAEFTLTTANTTRIGIKLASDYGQYTGGWTYCVSLGVIRNTSDTDVQTGLATCSNGDVVGIAVDLINNTLQFYKNNSALGTAITISNASNWVFWVGQNGSGSAIQVDANFGQQGFKYTPPTGFKALNTQNLPDPTIKKGNAYFDATIYTGDGVNGRAITSTVTAVDFAWVKKRSGADDHRLANTVTGGNKHLKSNATDAESTATTIIQSFSGNTFTVGSDNSVNASGGTYVGWNWMAGAGTTSSNTSGSITSTVSVNTTAGFSIVSYTGTGSNATVGHGLGVAPSFIIVFNRSGSDHDVYHVSLGNNSRLFLNTTAAASSPAGWNATSPTSSVFSLGSGYGDVNTNGTTYVAYCWAEVAGFSKFGSYTGNGSSDGPFVFCGFRPRYLFIKRTNSTGNWIDLDTSRSAYNSADAYISLNASSAEATGAYNVDILSNGFKLRYADPYGDVNASGSTYIYAAFAENPTKYALAR